MRTITQTYFYALCMNHPFMDADVLHRWAEQKAGCSACIEQDFVVNPLTGHHNLRPSYFVAENLVGMPYNVPVVRAARRVREELLRVTYVKNSTPPNTLKNDAGQA